MNPLRTFDDYRSEHGLTLHELAREIPGGVRVLGDGTTRVFGVRHDSRAVQPGELFVARKGAQTDGLHFLKGAKERGATAVLATDGALADDAFDIPALLVENVPLGLACAAAAVYGHPAFGLEIVGITGTNGKTTTAELVRAGIEACFGFPCCGMIGTVGYALGASHVEAPHTTPEADDLARLMAKMRGLGASHVAMEVSSIALALDRARAVRFRVAAFSNLTQDHLDFHETMERYAAAKSLLFTEYGPGAAVINVDDAFGNALATKIKVPLFRVTTDAMSTSKDAEIRLRKATVDDRGIDALFRTPGGEVSVRSPLLGRHNLDNIALALGILCALELDLKIATAGIGECGCVRGRLERCDDEEDDIAVLVDYAHSEDALRRALEALRPLSRGRIFCVFGCGGDRDKKKRAPMGEVAGLGSDVVVLTNDNPRTEDPEAIAGAVVRGIEATGAKRVQIQALGEASHVYAVELDRARAIACAVLSAQPGDFVLVAGKGHETSQIVGGSRHPFDDRAQARNALATRRETRASKRLASLPAGPTGED